MKIMIKVKFEVDVKYPERLHEFRPSFQRRYIKKPTPSSSKIPALSKIPAPVTKSREPQGVAVGEQAGIAIMENKLKTSKNYIEYLEKELRNTDFQSKKL